MKEGKTLWQVNVLSKVRAAFAAGASIDKMTYFRCHLIGLLSVGLLGQYETIQEGDVLC